ncbi:MAG: hypothetical protein ACOZQL_27805 [Myxococcota bacterium]
MRRPAALLLLGALALVGCPVAVPPGDVQMGTWAMTATNGVLVCELPEFGDGGDFSFTATLTADSASTAAWLTLSGYSRAASFDGQVFSSVGEASRVFADCSDCTTKVVETLTVAVLSRSQSEALGGGCPDDALDGGVPAPNDAGITGPRQTEQGFDAVRLCGVLATELIAVPRTDGGTCAAKCSACTTQFQLRGDRR